MGLLQLAESRHLAPASLDLGVKVKPGWLQLCGFPPKSSDFKENVFSWNNYLSVLGFSQGGV